MKNIKKISSFISVILTASIVILFSSCAFQKQNKDDTSSVNDISAVEHTPEIAERKTEKTLTYSLYVTGAGSIGVFSKADGSEQIGTLKCGTEVISENEISELSGYTFVKQKDGDLSGYVQNIYLVDTKASVTPETTVRIGENGSSLYSDNTGSQDVVETLSPDEEVAVLAKTSGGYWRVKTYMGNYGYVNVTDLKHDTISITETSSSNNEDDDKKQDSYSDSDTSSNDYGSSSSDDISLSVEETLSSAIENAHLVSGGSWSAAYIDLSTGERADVNNCAMQSASLIKLFIMGAVYENYDVYVSDEIDIDALLYSMITVSDNSAANTLVSILGFGDTDAGKEIVTSYCRSHGYSDTSMGRLLLESNINGDNYTSVNDCADFLTAVYNNSIPHSNEMLDLLSKQTITYKIPEGVPVRTANKTGELDSVQNDAAIVFSESPYVLCVMSEEVSSGAAVTSIVELSSEVYQASLQ